MTTTPPNQVQPHGLYRVQASELLLDAPIIAVRRDTITTATGDAHREIVEHFSAVAVVAVQNGNMLLIRQYRHAVGDYLWELPAGLLDKVDEAPLTAAQRELAEEGGIEADQWHLLGDIVTSPGFAEEHVRIYLAESVRSADSQVLEMDEQTGEEADIERRWVPVEQAIEWVRQGRIINSIAVAGISQFALGTRRSPDQPFEYPSGLRDRRQGAARAAGGADMKWVR